MSYLVVLVIDEVERCPELFDAWEGAGVSGITILESTGLGRMRRISGYRDDIPIMASVRSLLFSHEEYHRTVFTLVNDEASVDRLIAVTEKVLGNLDEPNKGVLFVLPVLRVVGIPPQIDA